MPKVETFDKVLGPYRSRAAGAATSDCTVQTYAGGRKSSRGFASWSEAAEFVRLHGGTPRAEPERPASASKKKRAPRGAQSAPVQDACTPTATGADEPHYWIKVLRGLTDRLLADPDQDLLKVARVIASLSTSARGHQDQEALAAKVAQLEAAFADMESAESHGCADARDAWRPGQQDDEPDDQDDDQDAPTAH